jgi:hypothetical protein
MTNRRRGKALGLLMMLALASLLPPASRAATDDNLGTRMFTIRFKAVEDVVLLIEPHIGEHGSYTVQPRLKAITVRDEPANLARIGELVAGFDQPPRSVRLVIQLLKAAEADNASNPNRRDTTGVPSLLRDVTKYSEVSVLGSASLVGVEGAQSSLSLGEEFRVRFRVDAVAEKQGVVKLDRFALDRVVKDPGGQIRYVPIIDTVVNLRNDQHLVLGATSSQESRRAIFLSVTATIEPVHRRPVDE